MNTKSQNVQPIPPFNEKNQETPNMGGGLPIIEYWAEHTLSPEGPKPVSYTHLTLPTT
jgi:hypothetical protein